MAKLTELKIGMRVCYSPDSNSLLNTENGIVKSFPEDYNGYVFIVYNCNGDWDNYMNYTGQSTKISRLIIGWM